MIKYIWLPLLVLLTAYSTTGAIVMITIVWLLFSRDNLTWLQVASQNLWLAPAIAAVLSTTRVASSLIALRQLRVRYQFDPIAQGDSSWLVARSILTSRYLQLLQSKGAGR